MKGYQLIATGAALIVVAIILGTIGKALVDAGTNCLYSDVYQSIRC